MSPAVIPTPRARQGLFPVRAAAVSALLVLLGIAAQPGYALDPSRAITQYRLDRWHTAEGLPQSSVESIAQTPDGHVVRDAAELSPNDALDVVLARGRVGTRVTGTK